VMELLDCQNLEESHRREPFIVDEIRDLVHVDSNATVIITTSFVRKMDCSSQSLGHFVSGIHDQPLLLFQASAETCSVFSRLHR
jgi:hypothetical protein